MNFAVMRFRDADEKRGQVYVLDLGNLVDGMECRRRAGVAHKRRQAARVSLDMKRNKHGNPRTFRQVGNTLTNRVDTARGWPKSQLWALVRLSFDKCPTELKSSATSNPATLAPKAR